MLAVIIPTLNAQTCLPSLLPELGNVRLVISDGGSADATLTQAVDAGAVIARGTSGRGAQLARGAELAGAAEAVSAYLFVHADCRLLPGWEADTPADIAEHFMKLSESKTEFMIYPPSTGNNYLMGRVTTIPAQVMWDSGGDWKLAVIPIDDTFSHAIINGMVYIAYDDDSDTPGNTPRSQVFYGRFLQDLGLRQQKEVKYKRA